MPRVAIVIPALNCAESIGEALISCLSQEYSELELVLIDDGSTDNTYDIVSTVAEQDPRIRIIRQPNGGIANALNAGLRSLADDVEYIARMDGDDIMLPGRIAAQVDYLDKHTEISVVTGRVKVGCLGGQLKQDGMVRYVQWLNSHSSAEDFARSMFIESPVCHPAAMIRRKALEDVGGYHDMAWTEDYDLWMRLHLAGHRFGIIDQDVVIWRDHVDRVTRTNPKCAPEIFYDLKAHFLAMRTKNVRIWNAGRDGKRLARSLAANGIHIHSFIDIDPKKIGGVRRGNIPVVSNDSLTGPNDGPLIVIAVGIPTVRPEIRAELIEKGYVEGHDFIFAA